MRSLTLSRFLIHCAVFLAAAPPAIAEDLVSATAARFRTDVGFLASDELRGRDAGSEGIYRAGEYIANRFADLGLETDHFDGTPFQYFELSGSFRQGTPEHNFLQFDGLERELSLEPGEHFNPLALGQTEGGFEDCQIVFAGYGITAPEIDYDDYAGIDTAGKVVIVLRKEPQQQSESSPFNGRENSQYAYFSNKEVNAANHQAAALILVNDSLTISGGEDELLDVNGGGRPGSGPTVPTFYCKREVIDSLLVPSLGKSLVELEQEIDSDLQPRSAELEGITASGEVKLEPLLARNVIGLLPGRGDLADEYVVVGAHYDHVGMGLRASLARGIVAVHNGADDNASGTVVMLEIARQMAASDAQNQRGILFMAFSAEEKGLLGSKHYVRNPRWPLEQTVAMINLDMVGRLDENTLTAFGTGTSPGFSDLLNSLNQQSPTPFNLLQQSPGRGPSDHQSFYERDIPVFHFFTGLHNDYHRPSDDSDKVNYEGMVRIASFVGSLVDELATTEQRPVFTKTRGRADVGRSRRRRSQPSEPTGENRRAIIGVTLDLQSPQVQVSAVNENGPADRAGIRPGDVILRVEQAEVGSIGDLQANLARRKPGDEVTLQVKRGETEMEFKLTLGEG